MKAIYGDTTIPLQVCRSAAGYYIGRLCDDPFPGAPYARDSDEYYGTAEEAQAALDAGTFTLRDYP